MINVKVSNIREELKQLNSYINEYNEVYLSLFQSLGIVSNNWKDNQSIKFNEKIYSEKNNSGKFFDELKHKRDVYQYICNSYEFLGNEITFNLNARSNINNEFDFAISKLTNCTRHIDNAYEGGLGYYSSQVAGSLSLRPPDIERLTNRVCEIKKEVNQLFDRLENIEQEIARKMDEYTIPKIVTFDMIYK